MYKFLFPCEPFSKNKEVDSSFVGEYNVCKTLGFDVYLFDYDILVEDNKFLSTMMDHTSGIFIYRGWMLKPEQYNILYDSITEKTNNKSKLISSYSEYRNLHCFPYVYDSIKNYTPKIMIINDYDKTSSYESFIDNIDFDFFIKDYVKSIKTDNGIEKISKNISYADLLNKVNNFINERGKLFTGGIVFKKFVNIKKIENKTNEWRLFVLNGELLCVLQNSYLDTEIKPPNDLIVTIINILKQYSNFFTVDFAQLEDDNWIVIETGDGQVSGISNESDYVKLYNNI